MKKFRKVRATRRDTIEAYCACHCGCNCTCQCVCPDPVMRSALQTEPSAMNHRAPSQNNASVVTRPPM